MSQKDDTISRQAAIDILDAYQVMIENGEKPYAWARLRMSELPSAQPEDYTELKREFLRMASYIDVYLNVQTYRRKR